MMYSAYTVSNVNFETQLFQLNTMQYWWKWLNSNGKSVYYLEHERHAPNNGREKSSA